MIEINGWISIHITTDGEDNSEKYRNAIEKIDGIVQPLKGFNQFFKIEALNGFYTLFIGLNHNHDNGYNDLILNLSNKVCNIAPGSYGILYIRNDEDKSNFNKFKVLKIAKGKVTIEEDRYISPCNPVIED